MFVVKYITDNDDRELLCKRPTFGSNVNHFIARTTFLYAEMDSHEKNVILCKIIYEKKTNIFLLKNSFHIYIYIYIGVV